MKQQLLILSAATVTVVGIHVHFGFAQSQQVPALPPDINAVTLSRFAPVTPSDLDAEGQKALAARTNPPNPGPGPGAAGSYSPRTSEAAACWGVRSACHPARISPPARAST